MHPWLAPIYLEPPHLGPKCWQPVEMLLLLLALSDAKSPTMLASLPNKLHSGHFHCQATNCGTTCELMMLPSLYSRVILGHAVAAIGCGSATQKETRTHTETRILQLALAIRFAPPPPPSAVTPFNSLGAVRSQVALAMRTSAAR